MTHEQVIRLCDEINQADSYGADDNLPITKSTFWTDDRDKAIDDKLSFLNPTKELRSGYLVTFPGNPDGLADSPTGRLGVIERGIQLGYLEDRQILIEISVNNFRALKRKINSKRYKSLLVKGNAYQIIPFMYERGVPITTVDLDGYGSLLAIDKEIPIITGLSSIPYGAITNCWRGGSAEKIATFLLPNLNFERPLQRYMEEHHGRRNGFVKEILYPHLVDKWFGKTQYKYTRSYSYYSNTSMNITVFKMSK